MTHTSLFLVALLLLGASTCAQTPTGLTAPPGYLNADGRWVAGMLGGYQECRVQFAEGGKSFRDRSAIIRRISYRTTTTQPYQTPYHKGRSWTQVLVRLGPCDTSKLTTTYSNNYTATPKVVFKGKFSMPAVTIAWPKQVWGNTADFALAAPFSKVKGASMIHDYEFRGGTLQNGRFDSGGRARYSHDAYFPHRFGATLATLYPETSTCNDWIQVKRLSAYVFSGAYSFPSDYPDAKVRNKISVYYRSQFTAPNANIIFAASLGGNPKGVSVPGWGCHRLYLNMAGLLGTRVLKTGPGQAIAGVADQLLPFRSSFVGQTVFMQGAWADSQTGVPKLTRASSWSVPGMPVANDAERWSVNSFGTSARLPDFSKGLFVAQDKGALIRMPVVRFLSK